MLVAVRPRVPFVSLQGGPACRARLREALGLHGVGAARPPNKRSQRSAEQREDELGGFGRPVSFKATFVSKSRVTADLNNFSQAC